jgi:predicted ArsR family transcriptional regulator
MSEKRNDAILKRCAEMAASNERKVARVLSRGGKMTMDEISEKAKLSRAATFQRLKALQSRGHVEELGERKARPGKGCTAILWQLCEGALDDLEMERVQAKERSRAISAPAFRHPMDVALFGDYVPAKNAPATRAEAA